MIYEETRRWSRAAVSIGHGRDARLDMVENLRDHKSRHGRFESDRRLQISHKGDSLLAGRCDQSFIEGYQAHVVLEFLPETQATGELDGIACQKRVTLQ